MRVRDLMYLLKDIDEDAEVRFASQPSWPFEYSITDVYEAGPGFEDPCDEPQDEDEDKTSIVYLVEGSQLGYLPGNVSRALGWK